MQPGNHDWQKHPWKVVAICAAVAFATPAFSQTVELSTRTFWVGERPRTMDLDRPFMSIRDIAWIEAVQGVDPALQDAVVHIELSFVPLRAFIDSIYNDEGPPMAPEEVPANLRLDGYYFYSPQDPSEVRNFGYAPIAEGADYIVDCSLTIDETRMSFCGILATYQPDDLIRLKARLYFPPWPADAPTYFQDVVDRMREVAYCLDVTDTMVNVPEVYPDLAGCLPDPTS